MEYRALGKTGLRVSALGFGCGNVGGLMIRGARAERERAVARALELGINYFDTAPSYGDGQSERNLGEALKAVSAEALVGTKFRLEPGDLADAGGAIARSLEASLRRLGRERVDLLQCHNHVALGSRGHDVDVRRLLDDMVPALEALKRQGKVGGYGITALGETAALEQAIDAGALHTAQVCYNLLNPTAGVAMPAGFPAHDFHGLLTRARQRGVGVIVIRVLAAGALSGMAERHPIAVPAVAPIASGPDYASDVARAERFRALVRDGHAGDLVEASLRFALGGDAVATVLLGYSSLEHLERAAAAVAKGPLSPVAMKRLSGIWEELAKSKEAPGRG